MPIMRISIIIFLLLGTSCGVRASIVSNTEAVRLSTQSIEANTREIETATTFLKHPYLIILFILLAFSLISGLIILLIITNLALFRIVKILRKY